MTQPAAFAAVSTASAKAQKAGKLRSPKPSTTSGTPANGAAIASRSSAPLAEVGASPSPQVAVKTTMRLACLYVGGAKAERAAKCTPWPWPCNARAKAVAKSQVVPPSLPIRMTVSATDAATRPARRGRP